MNPSEVKSIKDAIKQSKKSVLGIREILDQMPDHDTCK